MMAGVMLVAAGPHRHGHGGQVHPAPGRHRLHQRHRGAHRQHADQGLLRPAASTTCRAISSAAHARCSAAHCRRSSPTAAGLAACTLLVADPRAPTLTPRVPGYDRRARRRHASAARCWACRSRRSARASAASRRACRRFTCPRSAPDLILQPACSPALTVAMLGAIESLLSAVVADRMSGDRHNPNVELVAQGVANIVSPLFGGLPATGAIARTATNIRSGAQHAGRRHRPRADAARRSCWSAAPLAALHSAAGARRDPVRGRLEHGRVARDSRAAAA